MDVFNKLMGKLELAVRRLCKAEVLYAKYLGTGTKEEDASAEGWLEARAEYKKARDAISHAWQASG